MSASAIVVSTVLAVLLVLAIALLTGSLALLASGPGRAQGRQGGMAEALRLLDRQWRIERLIYRHHRLFGAVVLAAGAFCAWQLTHEEIATLLSGSSPASVLVWALLLGQGFNLLVGLVMLLRPSLLKPLEAVGNRWYRLEASGAGSPRAVRTTALLLALIGLIVLLGSATLLAQQISTTYG